MEGVRGSWQRVRLTGKTSRSRIFYHVWAASRLVYYGGRGSDAMSREKGRRYLEPYKTGIGQPYHRSPHRHTPRSSVRECFLELHKSQHSPSPTHPSRRAATPLELNPLFSLLTPALRKATPPEWFPPNPTVTCETVCVHVLMSVPTGSAVIAHNLVCNDCT